MNNAGPPPATGTHLPLLFIKISPVVNQLWPLRVFNFDRYQFASYNLPVCVSTVTGMFFNSFQRQNTVTEQP